MPRDDRTTKEKLIGLARTVAAKSKGDKLGFLEDKFVASIVPAVAMHRTLKQAVEWISNHLNPEDVFKPEQFKPSNKFRIKMSDLERINAFIKERKDKGINDDSVVAPIITYHGQELFLDIDMHNRDNVKEEPNESTETTPLT